jgi:uncharacterized repeat protein (TIGR02543 family)
MRKRLFGILALFLIASLFLTGCVKQQYDLAIVTIGQGTTTPGAGAYTYKDGTSLTVTAAPAGGWKFDKWSGDASGTDLQETICMDGPKNLFACFSKITYNLSLYCIGAGTTSWPIGTQSLDAGTLVSITATPRAGWKFDGWSDDAGSTSPILTQVIDKNTTITATFSKIAYVLSLAVRGNGTITPGVGLSSYDFGSEVQLKASPAEGWKFDGWIGGVLDPYSASTTTVMDATKSVTAAFSLIPLTTVQVMEEVSKIEDSTSLIDREYTWTFAGHEWTWDLQIPQALYDYYKALPRPSTKNYAVYVTHPLDDPFISQLVERIEETALEEGYYGYDEISLAAAFVQSMPYTSDSVTTGFDEYPRYPIETLVDDGGDCEDTAILMAALIDAMGYGAAIVIFPGSDTLLGHCATAVKDGADLSGSYYNFENGKYYYLETTGDGWEIGELPDEYHGADANLYGMSPVPILTHDWTGSSKGSVYELHVKIENLGSAAAQGVYVSAGFDAGDGTWWSSKKSPSFDLGINESITANLSLTVPAGKHTRLLIHVVYGGYTVDESYSEWFDS